MTETVLDPAPLPPDPPRDDSCCGSACEQCVWTVYQAELLAYRQALMAWQQRQAPKQEKNGG